MARVEQNTIKLVVESEQALYSKFSPEDEFDASVKSYIRSKIAGRDHFQNISLTVISRTPIDEERFWSAMSNWARDEKALLDVEMKDTMRLLIGSLIFGSIMIILSLMLQKNYEVLKYSLIPIMGTLSLSKATEILVIIIPTFNAKKKLINDMDKSTSVTFEYDHGKDENTENQPI